MVRIKPRGMRRWKVKIIGIGGFLPGKPLSNAELLARYPVETSDEWIRTHVGIERRHWAPEGIATSDLAAEAGKTALVRAGIHAADLDRIVLGTSTADWTNIAAACNVQHLLGADCPAEDTVSACASFMFALDHGARLIETGLR